MITAMLNALVCKIRGHNPNPLIEAWESKYGQKRSYYVCRRCLVSIGEKPYEH